MSWLTILKKKEAFGARFEGFDPHVVAAFGEQKREKLLKDAGIIRNRLKIRAVIENARRLLKIQESHGSFARWLGASSAFGQAVAKLFKKTFVFTGGESSDPSCSARGIFAAPTFPAARSTARWRKRPAWMKTRRKRSAA